MKILVTGGAGFIGSHIVDQLIKAKYQVCVVDNLSTGRKENLNPLARFYKLDILDQEGLERVFQEERPEYVIHQAAQINVQASLRNPRFDAEANILGTINLLRCCVKFQAKKIVYASSAAVYGKPLYLGVDEEHILKSQSFYGLSKQVSEQYIQTFADLYPLHYTILRYANVYGTRQDPRGEGGVVSIFLSKLLNKQQPVVYGDGTQTRDFIYVEDVAAANLAALYAGSGQIINISMNRQTSVLELLGIMNEICGTSISPIFAEARQGDILTSYLVNRKAQCLLAWEPVYSLKDGLRLTREYYGQLFAQNVV